MKTTFAFCIMLLFFSICGAFSDTITYIEKKHFRYELDNNDVTKIGYKEFDKGEVLSVNQVFLKDDYVLISDPIQRRIKKISLIDGNILCSSPKLFTEDDIITLLGIVNDKIYCFSLFGRYYIMNMELGILEEDSIPDFFGEKYFYKLLKDTMIIYREPIDVFQDEKHLVSIKSKMITPIFKDSMIVELGKGYEKYKSFKKGSINGKNTSGFLCENSKLEFLYNDDFYIIREIVPENKLYLCQSFDFSDKFFVFYYFDKNEMILTVLSL